MQGKGRRVLILCTALSGAGAAWTFFAVKAPSWNGDEWFLAVAVILLFGVLLVARRSESLIANGLFRFLGKDTDPTLEPEPAHPRRTAIRLFAIVGGLGIGGALGYLIAQNSFNLRVEFERQLAVTVVVVQGIVAAAVCYVLTWWLIKPSDEEA